MSATRMTRRIAWPAVIDRAAAIVGEYDTPVTLRQLFYRLVAGGWLPNVQSAYSRLSDLTAKRRRDGTFPRLADNTRTIVQHPTWTSPHSAAEWLAKVYRRDRTEGQMFQVFLGVEKAGIVAQLEQWFGDLGVPIVALRGYSSQGYVDDIADAVDADGRMAVLLYAGDFDPSGEDIVRDFRERSRFAKVVRVALTAEQVDAYNLPPAMGKATDTRARGFAERHGRLVQVELDALAPDDLRRLYADAMADYWDESTYQRVLAVEGAHRDRLFWASDQLAAG